MKYKISAIVPIYNVPQKYLFKCFDSIDKQTFKNYEIIIVNDGSTDLSIDKYLNDNFSNKKNYKIISYAKNRGLGPARNIGIKYSSGQIITFIDSDDFITANAFEIIAEQFNKYTGLQVAFFGSSTIDDEGKIISEKINDFSLEPTNVLKDFWLITHKISAWAKAFDRGFIIKNKVFFLDKKVYQEDLYFYYNILSKARSIVVIPQSIYVLQQRVNSLTQSSFTIKKAYDIFYNLEQIYESTKDDKTIVASKFKDIFEINFAKLINKEVEKEKLKNKIEWKEFYKKAEEFKNKVFNK